MNKIWTFITGFFSGGFVITLVVYLVFLRPNYKYVELKSDYFIENGGLIKQGSILRVDEPLPEGFTRYILYLNLRDSEAVENHKEEREDVIVPYWLQPDTTAME